MTSGGEDGNPAPYDAYARAYPGYRETSRDLIALALPAAAAGARVLDLACGTGATTREILAVLGPGPAPIACACWTRPASAWVPAWTGKRRGWSGWPGRAVPGDPRPVGPVPGVRGPGGKSRNPSWLKGWCRAPGWIS